MMVWVGEHPDAERWLVMLLVMGQNPVRCLGWMVLIRYLLSLLVLIRLPPL